MSANVDRRRILGPERSFPPVYAPLDSTASGSTTTARKDVGQATDTNASRSAGEMRPLFIKTGLISQANGSGYIECGAVKIACAVYGPRPKPPPYSPEGTLNLEVKFAPFASHPRRAPLRDTEPPHLSHLLHSHLLPALQLHTLPKSSIDIYLLVLQSESPSIESVLASGLTVCAAAVADAGIAMNGLGVGLVTSLSGSSAENAKPTIQLDPEGVQAREADARVTVGCLPALDAVSDVWVTGEVTVDNLISMINECTEASKTAHATLAQAILEGEQNKTTGMSVHAA